MFCSIEYYHLTLARNGAGSHFLFFHSANSGVGAVPQDRDVILRRTASDNMLLIEHVRSLTQRVCKHIKSFD